MPATQALPSGTNDPRSMAAMPWIALAALIQALLYLALLPPWLGEDEPWQVESIHHVAAGHWPALGEGLGERPFSAEQARATSLSQLQTLRRFPTLSAEDAAAVQSALMDELRQIGLWERVRWLKRDRGAQSFDAIVPGMTATHHPPLYAASTGAVARATGLGALEDLEGELWLARAVSGGCWIGFVVAGALCARALGASASLAASVLLFAPVSWRESAIAGNDAPAALAGALALLFALRASDPARGGLTPRALLGGSALMALALAIKPSTLVAASGCGLALVIGARTDRRWRAATALILVALLASAIALWLAGHAPAIPKSVDALLARIGRGLSPTNLRRLAATSAGMHSWESQALPAAFYAAAAVLGVCLGLAALAAQRSRGRAAAARLALWLAVLVALGQLALVIARGESRGRYLLPALPAAAALASAGIESLSSRCRDWAGAGWCCAWPLLGAAYLGYGLSLDALWLPAGLPAWAAAPAYAAAWAALLMARRVELRKPAAHLGPGAPEQALERTP